MKKKKPKNKMLSLMLCTKKTIIKLKIPISKMKTSKKSLVISSVMIS